MEKTHTRMPIILHESDWDEWLLREGPAPVHLLKPFPAGEMSKHVVRSRSRANHLLSALLWMPARMKADIATAAFTASSTVLKPIHVGK